MLEKRMNEVLNMSFAIVTDTSCNLPTPQLKAHEITVVPFYYYVKGEELSCLDTEAFDGAAYYDLIKAGEEVNTSQINPQRFIDFLSPLMEAGKDVLYIGMSSGISGAYNSSLIAAEELKDEYPDREMFNVDTKCASLAEGMAVLEAVACREKGMSLADTAAHVTEYCKSIYQVFTVGDLMHLKRTGRISGALAIAGTVLGIKPLLKGNELGQIVNYGKARGKKAFAALADKFEELAKDAGEHIVYLAHTNAPEECAYVEKLIRNKPNPPKDVVTCMYEPVTGAHVGPGTVALFFYASEDCRGK